VLQSVRPELARRIVLEADAIQTKFPNRFSLSLNEQGRPCWTGSVPIEGREFPVVLVYPSAYPALPPMMHTLFRLPPNCPHLLGRDGPLSRLCWIASNARGRRKWDPQRHTAATAMRAAQRWGLAFLVWQTTGRWPVPDAFETLT